MPPRSSSRSRRDDDDYEDDEEDEPRSRRRSKVEYGPQDRITVLEGPNAVGNWLKTFGVGQDDDEEEEEERPRKRAGNRGFFDKR